MFYLKIFTEELGKNVSRNNEHIIKHISWSIKDNRNDVFSNIYCKNLWQSNESKSGKGSEIAITKILRDNLKELLTKYEIKTIIDAPCGDYNWFNYLDFEFVKYYGIDIVSEIIEINKQKYKNDKILFDTGDILTYNFQQADLVFCRDCFIHLTFDEIHKAILNFKKSNSKYLLVTNYEFNGENKNIITGQFRKINLLQTPFNFPKPIDKIVDNIDENKFMYLWKLEDLNCDDFTI